MKPDSSLPMKSAPLAVESAEYTRGGQVYKPNVDILETEGELLLRADMPGVKREDIDIQLERGSLTLHGRVRDRAPKDGVFLLREYGVGEFQRSFEVGESVDSKEIRAEFHEGVLTVHLPKLANARPRRIEVQGR